MRKIHQPVHIVIFFLMVIAGWMSCDNPPPPPKPKVIIRQPELLNPRTSEQVLSVLDYAEAHGGLVDDSIRLTEYELVRSLYPVDAPKRLWSEEKRWLERGDSLYAFLVGAENYGLFPSEYHFRELKTLRKKLQDTAARQDAALWSRGELMVTDAFLHMARHLKLGRIGRDSVTLRTDSTFDAALARALTDRVVQGEPVRTVLESLEPRHSGYLALRAALPGFLDSLDRTPYTYVVFPQGDTLNFLKQLQARLFESSYITFNTRPADSSELSSAIRKAQVARGLTIDGKPGPQLVRSLNNTGMERLKRIAINLDRYKQLPDSMPDRYIWVNLPQYTLWIMEGDSSVLESKVIVGQPKTRTPVLTSTVTNFVTFPQWTVPSSIIFKEMLPRIQKDIGYLRKENLMVVDRYDSVIDPATVNWARLSKTNFPYTIRQRQGDDNSLGVMKFNFRNKFDVYLHDTNARSLFARSIRALSHGCVRLQKWDSLSHYLVRSDSTRAIRDSVTSWLKRGEKHQVSVPDRLPIYLRYFTTLVSDGRIRLIEDIYGDDKLLRERYLTK
jgi:murein L,D-transpeptidase YcbB/YkuD